MDAYFFYSPEASKISGYRLAELAAEFRAAESAKTLATMLRVSKGRLKELARAQPYDRFYIAKQSGGARLIEHPDEPLKRIQQDLNLYLGAVYHEVKPSCAHGAILATLEDAQPRSLLTNARAHLGAEWYLSLDLKDFFHSISAARVRALFAGELFRLPEKMARLLTQLVTAQQHVPIGAPTSATLANIICLSLDRTLTAWAAQHKRTYTRFLDDFTFSGQKPFKEQEINALEVLINKEGFKVNAEKTTLLQLEQEPEVTGLVMKKDDVDVGNTFLSNIVKGIELYHRIINSHLAQTQVFPSHLLRRLRQHLMGQLSFLKFVRGGNHTSYIRLKKRLFEGVEGVVS